MKTIVQNNTKNKKMKEKQETLSLDPRKDPVKKKLKKNEKNPPLKNKFMQNKRNSKNKET